MPAALRPSVALFAGLSAAIALPPLVCAGGPTHASELAQLRATGPAGLDQLLARFDRATDRDERDALAADIDAVAAQRYASVSRLYWYTDLAAAEDAAEATHRPILALRMLGRLDEDLSCANSRLFRATLYANAEISQFLRDHFVLYWSSERPVPRVTIDFGDGRKIVTTTTGNSAHYVLDEHGHVLDVLPGLYAPVAFRTELAKSLALADRVRPLDDAARAAEVVRYHRDQIAMASAAWSASAGQPYTPGRQIVSAAEGLAAAQRATISKARIEVPVLHRIALGADPGTVTDPDMWIAIGQRLYAIDERGVIDAKSRALVEQLHGPATPAQRARIIDRLEASLVADTALDQIQLRPQISRHIVDADGQADFGTLNAWVYASVFATPASDRWLGLLPRSDFTGLPRDGIVTP